MDMFFNIFKTGKRSKMGAFRWVGMIYLIGITTVAAMDWCPTPSTAASAAGSDISAFYLHPDGFRQVCENHRATILGQDTLMDADCERQGRYAIPLGQSDSVDLLERRAPSPPVYGLDDVLRSDGLIVDLCQALNRMPPVEADGSGDKSRSHDGAARRSSPSAVLSVREKFRVYLVRRGDSLWKIAKQFDMQYRTLAKINELGANDMLEVGRPLKVKTVSSQELTLSIPYRDNPKDPIFLTTIRMTDGRPVPRWLVEDFTAEIVENPSATTENAVEDDIRGPTVVVSFHLAKTPLEAQARRFQPIVLTHAARYNVDPALIMAMIHTESFFNPHSRSKASAYGLMQLVPDTAGLEAYGIIYGHNGKLTPEYLLDPDNNIELGTAYLHILKENYMRSIADPVSRTYCAVAAYHAGPSNVGRAFIPRPSIRQAIPVINRLSPADVYKRLVEALPTMESRNYVRKVIVRLRKYRSWYPETNNARRLAHTGNVRL